jgi:hypothetical protein
LEPCHLIFEIALFTEHDFVAASQRPQDRFRPLYASHATARTGKACNGSPDHGDVGLSAWAGAAKRMLFTGDKIKGPEAEKLGLVLKSVAPEKLDDEVEALAERMAGVPVNQLMQKAVVRVRLTRRAAISRATALSGRYFRQSSPDPHPRG